MREKKIFLDACVLMDFFAGRNNCDAVEAILSLAERKKLECFTSGNIICTLAFLFEKYKVMPKKEIPKVISSLLDVVQILPVDKKEIDWAVENSSGDFEDAVECACAAPICDIIITDNIVDFKISEIQVSSPEAFASSLV